MRLSILRDRRADAGRALGTNTSIQQEVIRFLEAVSLRGPGKILNTMHFIQGLPVEEFLFDSKIGETY